MHALALHKGAASLEEPHRGDERTTSPRAEPLGPRRGRGGDASLPKTLACESASAICPWGHPRGRRKAR